jgi:hypothetical protein
MNNFSQVTITLRSGDTVIGAAIKAVTDGAFIFDKAAENGRYTVSASFTGYTTASSEEFEIKGADMAIPAISLEKDFTQDENGAADDKTLGALRAYYLTDTLQSNILSPIFTSGNLGYKINASEAQKTGKVVIEAIPNSTLSQVSISTITGSGNPVPVASGAAGATVTTTSGISVPSGGVVEINVRVTAETTATQDYKIILNPYAATKNTYSGTVTLSGTGSADYTAAAVILRNAARIGQTASVGAGNSWSLDVVPGFVPVSVVTTWTKVAGGISIT